MEALQPASDRVERPETASFSSSSGASNDDNDGPDAFQPIRSTGTRRRGDGTDNDEDAFPLRRHDSLALMDESDHRELQRLATSMSRAQSRTDSVAEAGYQGEGGVFTPSKPELDPTSASFDLYSFLKNVVGQMRKEGIVSARVGVAFKDLTVSGTGDALQLQHTIGDWLQMPLRLGEHLSFRKKEHKTILHQFDGIINSGDLLIVLGRPGSGCSTLLRSLTGQLHGLTVADKSIIHYNGIPQPQMMKEFKGEAIYNQEVSMNPVKEQATHQITPC
jgi:ATP-binding cassette, subfamily G (WHITE), member 2, PDR